MAIGQRQGGVRSDFLWRRYRLAGEADGRVKYSDLLVSRIARSSRRKARQLRLEEAGFVVVRWTGGEIQRDPDRVIHRIVRHSRVASEIYGVPILLAQMGTAGTDTTGPRYCSLLPAVLSRGNWHADLS